ncbi:membrane protein insertion efficiency factor YidD [candidate division TA06 bacterium]|nr:membrane protein insertion efficiency factor YidD [candidate division TA06 bacterium]
MKIISIGLIKYYKSFISSQDRPSCVFFPSCSSYGMECIERFGLIKGSIIISDRLQRCHSLGIKYYDIDSLGRASDPLRK